MKTSMTLLTIALSAILALGAFVDVAYAQEADVSREHLLQSSVRAYSHSQIQEVKGRCSAWEGLPTDLSGVYTVKAKSSRSDFGNGTLTVKKDRFEFAGKSGIRTGRVVATTSCGDTSVALTFENPTPGPKGPTLEVVSLNAVASKSGKRIWLNSAFVDFALALTTDPDNMYDVHFLTDPSTAPVNIITDLKWRQCADRDKEIKKCPWQAAGDPEKMLGVYHYYVEWTDGRSKNGELELTGNKTFTITP